MRYNLMMVPSFQRVQTIYLVLAFFNTLAASFIWGIDTLFLLSAGLSNTQAFSVNAFFTIGQMIFEVPTGMVADLKGRRTSYILGTLTLAASTLFYLSNWYFQAPFLVWGVASMLLGLGFTFFSGATDAWLVDAVHATGYKKSLEPIFAKYQIVSGIAMLSGSVAGGLIAQTTSLQVPYVLRAVVLLITFVIAVLFMKDWGFTPRKSVDLAGDFKKLFVSSFTFGWRLPALRWVMLAAPLASGVGFYTFYAMQPFLLQLYGNPKAYAVAGLAAAIVAGSQILGGLSVGYVRKLFKKRTTILGVGAVISIMLLIAIGLTNTFWLALVLLSLWGLISAMLQPVRSAYLNNLIPSSQRATVLSFDSLLSSSGGIVVQPLLGRVSDIWSYGLSFVVGALLQVVALPLILLARAEESKADQISE